MGREEMRVGDKREEEGKREGRREQRIEVRAERGGKGEGVKGGLASLLGNGNVS